MIEFGTSGVAVGMGDLKGYDEIAKALKEMGLTCFEYPLTYGTNISDEKCEEIGNMFREYGIKLSVHAPYYINFASPDELSVQKTFSYLYNSMKKAKCMGADRVVFHPGSLTKQEREVAVSNVLKNLKSFIEQIDGDELVDGVLLCPETMGKHGQIGTPKEVAEMCKISPRFIPTIDFGHINAFTNGELKETKSFEEVLKIFVEDLGIKEIHIHFSKIEYGLKGEIKHLTFATDPGFGPSEKNMVDSLKKYDANYRVISESAGTQDIDAKIMLDYYKKGF